MNKNTISIIAILSMLSFLAAACMPQAETKNQGISAENPLQLTVSLIPQAYFVDRIGGDLVTVNVMVGPGEEAHTYEPKPEQMQALSDSSVFFSIGIEYEETWLPRFQDVNPDLVIIDVTEGIERILRTVPHSHDEDDHAHEADEDDGHSHDDESGLDPHVWLSPANGKIIARNILNALNDVAPEHAETFQANYEGLVADIDALDAQIKAIFSSVEQTKFMVYHPAWGYFADQYGLTQLPIQIGGTDPSASELAAIVDEALEENIRVIFVQPSFSQSNAETIAREINGEVHSANPLAYDWLANLEAVAEAFAAALSK
jgi:zinc transport system substrate-binding protein